MKYKANLIRYKNVTQIDVNDKDQMYYLVCEWCFSYGQIREAVRHTKSTELKVVHGYLQRQKATTPQVPPRVRITKFVHGSKG